MLPTYEQMGDWLEEIAAEFPEAFFEELDGGIQRDHVEKQCRQRHKTQDSIRKTQERYGHSPHQPKSKFFESFHEKPLSSIKRDIACFLV